MPAITVRNLPAHVHWALKQHALTANLSAEELVRRVLARWVERPVGSPGKEPTSMSGFSEASAGWPEPPALAQASHADLWGALKGSVRVPPETDLTAPLEEVWDATA